MHLLYCFTSAVLGNMSKHLWHFGLPLNQRSPKCRLPHILQLSLLPVLFTTTLFFSLSQTFYSPCSSKVSSLYIPQHVSQIFLRKPRSLKALSYTSLSSECLINLCSNPLSVAATSVGSISLIFFVPSITYTILS